MKTLLITRQFPPLRCGVGDYTAELARFLRRRGQEVSVLTAPTPKRQRSAAGSGVLELPMRGWRDLIAVLRVIAREAPGMVQFEYSNYGWSRWGCAFWLNALFFVLRMRGVSLRLALHEFPLNIRQHFLVAPIALVQRLHFWMLCASAQEICTNTPERVATLRRCLPWRKQSVRYRPNSNCNPVFSFPAEWRKVLREDRGVQPGDLVVAMYGLFGAGKNLEAAIESVVQLVGELPLHLWLLGDSSQANRRYLEKLRTLAAPLGKRVWWSGNLSPEDVSRHLQAVDIFLLPQPDGHLTRSGSFMAAAAHGLPVVAARNNANQKDFLHATHFWQMTSSTANEIACAIRHLAAHQTLREHLGKNIQTLYTEQFDWKVLHMQQISDVAQQPRSFPKAKASEAGSTGR